MCGCTEKALFPSIKIPTVGPAEEEPGVLLRQHPALPAPTSAASDKRACRNRRGEHSQRHANGHRLFLLSLFVFFFFIKNTKATPTPSSSCGPKPGSSCSSALLLPPAALRSRWQFELLLFFFCRRDRECNDLKTNNPPTTQSLVPKSLEGIPQSVLARP